MKPAATAKVVPMVATSPKLATKRGVIDAPLRMLVYGLPGVGKTTFASEIPNAVWLCDASGTEQFDVERLPEPRAWRNGPKGEEGICLDVFSLLDWLATADHAFSWLVVDTLDSMEQMLHAWICKRANNAPSLAQAWGGFGKGTEAASTEFRHFTEALKRLRDVRKMNVCLIAHATTDTAPNPEGEDFEKFTLKIHKKAGSEIQGWSDTVLFAHQPISTLEKESSDRYRGGFASQTMLYTQRKAAFDAKNRLNLPPRIPLSWQAFLDAAKPNAKRTPDDIRLSIAGLAEFVSEADQTEALAMVERVGDDVSKLTQIEKWLGSLQPRAQ